MKHHSQIRYVGYFDVMFPIFFILLCFAELIFFHDKKSYSIMSPNLEAIFVGTAYTFLLNFTHTGLTLSTWLNFPASQEWLGKKITFKFQVIFFATACTILFVVYGYSLYYRATWMYYGVILFNFLLTWHGLGQTKGISIYLNRHLMFVEAKSVVGEKAVQKINYFEHRISFILFLSYVVMHMVLRYNLYEGFNLTENEYRKLCVGINSIIVAYLVYKSWFLINLSPIKALFTLRYLLWILTPLCFFGNVGVLAVHGMEYTLFTYRMVKETSSSEIFLRWRKHAIGFGLIIFSLGFLVPNGFGFFSAAQSETWKILGIIASAIIMSITTVHVLFDKYFYVSDNYKTNN